MDNTPPPLHAKGRRHSIPIPSITSPTALFYGLTHHLFGARTSTAVDGSKSSKSKMPPFFFYTGFTSPTKIRLNRMQSIGTRHKGGVNSLFLSTRLQSRTELRPGRSGHDTRRRLLARNKLKTRKASTASLDTYHSIRHRNPYNPPPQPTSCNNPITRHLPEKAFLSHHPRCISSSYAREQNAIQRFTCANSDQPSWKIPNPH